MSQYSETMGSFIRTSNYPLEANYIFESEEQLKEFYTDELNKTLLHKGWFKVIDNGETQSLYWIVNKDDELTFTKLISEGDITSINKFLDDLNTKLDEEIAKREENDEDEKSRLEYIEESIKAIVGSEDPVKEYLETLDYKNLTELSDALNVFLNTYTEDDSIDTLPEIKDFLAGYTHTHNLEQVLDDLWNKIEGDPTPNLEFRTLRGIQDFITRLAQVTKNRDDNLQTELNQTQVGVGLDSDGSFSPDQETYYLKTATSVMNALRTLDSLINQAINNCNIQPKDTNTVSIDITKEATKTTISANVKLSPDPNNDIQEKENGLYHNIDTEYENGILTIKVNGNVRKQHVLGLSSIVDNAYYDADSESIVIIFKLQNNDKQTITIPVASLISEWEVDNSIATKVVELTKERVVAGGADKLSADVRISTNKTNILEKDGNTLLVRGTADNIIYNGDVTVKSKLDSLTEYDSNLDSQISNLNTKIDSEVTRAKEAEENLADEITESRRIEENLVNSLTSEIQRSTDKDAELEASIKTERDRVIEVETKLTQDLRDEVQRSTNADTKHDESITKLTSNLADLNTKVDDEISRAIQKENEINLNLQKEIDRAVNSETQLQANINDEVTRATDAETLLGHRIDDLKEFIDTNTDNDTNLTIRVTNLETNLTEEVNRAKLAETELANKIVQETERATQREDFIDNRITDHINDHNNPHQVTADQINVYTKDKVNDLLEAINTNHEATTDEINNNLIQLRQDFGDHLIDYSNPHKVTKAQIGLDKVDNTTDLEKPISVATQEALHNLDLKIAEKADGNDLSDHIFDHDNPHLVTKEQIGLNNVDNTSDLNKPISIATQMALDKKSDIGHTHTMSDISDLENLPIVKGFVNLLSDLPETANGGDKYILTTKVSSGVTRYTLCEYDGSNGTWKQKLLTTGNVASITDKDVFKLNSSGVERVLDVSDYNYFYNKIYDETKNLIEDIDWEEDDETSDTNNQVRLKITYKTSYGDPNESEATNPYETKAVKYIDIEKARFLSDAYSRPANQSDVDNGYAAELGEPVLVLVMTTGDHVTISLKDALNIYDPIDTASINTEITDWTGDPSTSYKISSVLRLASVEDKNSAVSLYIKDDAEKGLYSVLHTQNTNSISLNPATGANGSQKTLTANLNIDNQINNDSDVLLTIGTSGLSAKLIWGEYD